jgi:hypothetical protein
MLETKLKPLAILCLVLGLTLSVPAANYNWTGGNADANGLGYWDDPGNWDTYPTASDQAFLQVASSTVVVDDFDDVNYPIKECSTLILARTSPADDDVTLWINSFDGSGPGGVFSTGVIKMAQSGAQNTQIIVDAGELNCSNLRVLQLGSAAGGSCFITVNGGVLNAGTLGLTEQTLEAQSTLTVNGGLVDVAGDLWMGQSPAEVSINLNGGTLTVGGNFEPTNALSMDITAGKLILAGDVNDVNDAVQGYIDNGWITAYGSITASYGTGTVLVETVEGVEDSLIVKGLHPFNPVPEDGGVALPGTVTLEWTVDAGTLVDVWFGTKADRSDFTKIVNKQAETSKAVATVAKQQYFWAVDTYLPGEAAPEIGFVFGFTADNQAPVVDAGDDVPAWLENGIVDVSIAGTVDDDDPTTTVWTVVSEPNDPNSPDAVIADPAALNTTITLSALGEYVLQLEADDGDYKGADTLTISVFADSCLAAQSLPDYVALLGDLDGDCDVDQDDLDLLRADWLKCVALGECYPNVPIE